MSALSTAATSVNPSGFTKLHDDRQQREQYRALSRVVRIDHLNRHDARAARGAVRAAVLMLPPGAKRDAELLQLPHARQFAALVGFYAQALKLGFENLHLSVRQIEQLTGVCRSNINWIHRWLCQIGWLNVRPGLALGIKHTCATPHEGDCRCRERPWNRSAIRTLTTLAHKALRIFYWVKSKVLLGCDVVGRLPVFKDFQLEGLPGRSRPGDKQRPKGGVSSAGRALSALWERGQSCMRFIAPKKEDIVKDMNAIDGRHEAMKRLQRERLELVRKARGGDVLAACEALRRWPQYKAGFDLPPHVLEAAEARLAKQRAAVAPPPDDIPY